MTRNLEALKRELRTAKGCAPRSQLVEKAVKEGFVSCKGCGAFKAKKSDPCHECGLGTTPLGAGLSSKRNV